MTKKELSEIIYESNDGIAKITLNRPHKLNSLTSQMHADLRSALDGIDQDPNIKVVLLTGAGKGFCAGQDIDSPDFHPDQLASILDIDYNPLIQRLTTMKQVVIAAVNGIAAGAGCNLALAADLTIASKQAGFKQAFIHIGLLPDAGGTWFLPKKVGLQKAMGLAMTGNTISGEEADQMGLIWKAVDHEVVMTEAEQLARQLASYPSLALTEIKKAIYAANQNSLIDQLNIERDAQARLGKTLDFQEGIDAFRNKRPAKFKGI